uniref:MIF4G domain-containing protein n=1 Tax=Romanomermis culicivorax TaxID=13658 RepID=A0A915KL95_ROMCU
METENEPATSIIISTSEVTENEIRDYITNLKKKMEMRLNLRQANLSVDRPDESMLRKLDSNLKKNTAFVKKVKLFTDSQKVAILKEFQSLNLSKYVGELASSISEAKLKISDVPAIVELCSLIHQRYADFANNLLESYFKKVFPKRKDDVITNLSKFRVDIRLLADLIIAGIFSEKDALNVLGAALNFLVQCDKEEHQFLPIIISFCKFCGEDFGNFVPRRYKLAAIKFGLELPQIICFIGTDRQNIIVNLFKDYAAKLNEDLLKHFMLCTGDSKYQSLGDITP